MLRIMALMALALAIGALGALSAELPQWNEHGYMSAPLGSTRIGGELSQCEYYWNGQWDPTQRWLHTYSDSNPTHVSQNDWFTQGQWDPSNKTEDHLDALGRLSLQRRYGWTQQGEWVPVACMVYHYDTSGYLELIEQFEWWEGPADHGEKTGEVVYTYQDGRLSMVQNYSILPGNFSYVTYMEAFFYDAEGRISRVDTAWVTDDWGFSVYIREHYSYDAQGRLAMITHQSGAYDSYQTTGYMHYTYGPSGLLSERLTQHIAYPYDQNQPQNAYLEQYTYNAIGQKTQALNLQWTSGAVWQNWMMSVYEYEPSSNGGQQNTPPAFSLSAFPNPFSGKTDLRFSLEAPSRVRITVYDLRGRKLRELCDAGYPKGVGALEWDGRDDGGRKLPNGLYLIRMEGAEKVVVCKVMLINQ